MENQITVFASDKFGDVRIVQIGNEPWFVGKDIATALGYGEGKSLANAVANHVDVEDKGVTKMMTPGGKQNVTIINESGLYSLIMSSKLPQAKAFKRWVTSEILPTIRKHGAYLTDNALEEALTSPDFLIKLATQLKKEKQARLEAEKKIEEQKPKVIFADAVSASKTSILIGDLAKLIRQNGVEVGQKRLFEWLRQNG